MIKFLLGVAMVAFGSLCGYLLAKKFRQRKQFFKQLKEFNERFLSEIAYYRRPVREFAAAYSYEGEFQSLLTAYFLSTDEDGFTQKFFAIGEEYAFLKEDERRTVEDYFLMLGKGDSASQKAYFSSVKERLNSLQADAENKAKRYGDLYVKIGFLCGLLVLILIV